MTVDTRSSSGSPRTGRGGFGLAAHTALLASILFLNGSWVFPAAARTPTSPPLPFIPFGPREPLRGAVAPGVYAAAAQDTVYFGGTFWNPDSARWEALRDSAWTFDTGVGSSMVPPGGSTYPGVNPYKQPGLHQTMEGWIGIDNTYSELSYFRRLSSTQTDCVGSAAGLGGSWSFYAGVLPQEAAALCFAAGAGYGNSWNICIGKSFDWTGGPVHLTYKYRNDSEPNYDYTFVKCDTAGDGTGDVIVTSYTGPISGSADLTLTPGINLPAAGPRTVVIKFCADSDGAYSDEDGNYPTTCGEFAFDDVALTGGIVQPLENFETGDGGWALLAPPPGLGGEWSNVVSLDDLPPPVSPCACSLRDSVLVFEDLDEAGHGLHQTNVAASPWIDLKGRGRQTPGKFISTQVFADLPLLNYVFAIFEVQWYPELCPNTGKLITSSLRSDGFAYHWDGAPTCLEVGTKPQYSLDFSSVVPEGAEKMRIAVGVTSFCQFNFNCTGVTNSSPWFDRVRLGTYGVSGAPYLSTSSQFLPQDSFPEDGTLKYNSTGRIDSNVVRYGASRTWLGDTLVVMGGVSSDPVEVRVQFAVSPGPGVDDHKFQTWIGKHRFEEMKNGLSWYSARMDTAENANWGPSPGIWMTSYHEEDPNFTGADRDIDPTDYSGRGGHLGNDIFPDHLLTPGSRLMLFYKAHVVGSPVWYLLPDTTGGNCFEMEVLPSSMRVDGSHNSILYVNHADDREDDHLLESALAQVLPDSSANFEHTAWDRFDVRASSNGQSSFGRPSYSNYGAYISQAIGYREIVWDGGFASHPLSQADGNVLTLWLTLSYYLWPEKCLYLSGDGIVSSTLAGGLAFSDALALLENHAAVDLGCASFRSANCPSGAPADPTACPVLAPVFGARVANRFRPSVQTGQENACPGLRQFDVLSVDSGAERSSPTPDERYEGSVKAAPYASISNQGSGDGMNLGPFKTVVDGVALRHRRDAGTCTTYPGAPPAAMVQRLQEVLGWFSHPDTATTGIGGPAEGGWRTALAPLVPNPVPAGSPARLAFSLARDGNARVTVYSLSGERVRTVFSGLAHRGDNETVWDLKDERGKPVAAGLYFVRLQTAGTALTRKLVVAVGR